jgi:hypothetical protein
MITNHTTRTAVRASALATVVAGLLLGAPAIAFGSPNDTITAPTPGNARSVAGMLGTTPAPTPSVHDRVNEPCLACVAVNPTLTGSDSGDSEASGNHPVILTVSGRNFTPGGTVHFGVWVDGHPASCVASDAPADPQGVIDGDRTGCHTDALAATNGYVIAPDLATGKQTTRLSVMVLEH